MSFPVWARTVLVIYMIGSMSLTMCLFSRVWERCEGRTTRAESIRDNQFSDVKSPDIEHSAIKHSDIKHSNIKHSNIKHSNIKHSDIKNLDIKHSDIKNLDIKHSDIKHQSISRPQEASRYANLSELRTYLRLSNLIYPDLDPKSVSNLTRKTFEDIIRKGLYLKPYVTERGESGWMENGIVYRPWRRPDPSTMHKTHPSPFYAEYEPYVPFNEKMFFAGRRPTPGYRTEKQKIITWIWPTRYYNKALLQPEPLKSCPDFPCLVTTNKTYIPNSSALIFAAQLINWKNRLARFPNQVYVLHNHEPPFENKEWRVNAKSFRHKSWKKAFNYTMTYRTDSDFVVPYGIVRKRPKPIENKDYKTIVAQKNTTAVWVVSNCNTSSKRWEYVEELRNYIDIDIYGECGSMTCPHAEKDRCDVIMAKRYKFYLAFESAYCQDYITEKLFHYLSIDLVVVARGIDQYYQHVPPEVYLNTADFPSPKALAERMLYLHHNDDAYIEMLKEKDKYITIAEGYPVRNKDDYIRSMAFRFEAPSICLLCQRLWNLDLYAKTIPDIHAWFDKRVCRTRNEVQLEF